LDCDKKVTKEAFCGVVHSRCSQLLVF